MGINRASQNGGGGGGDETVYLPLPDRTWRLEIISATFKPSQREGWRDQIGFALQVAPADRERLKKMTPVLEPGRQQGDRCWFSAGATFNGWKRDGIYNPTALAEFVSALFGASHQARVRELIRSGWIVPGTDSDDDDEVNEGLKWLVGLELYAKVEHPKPNADGRVFPRVKAATPVGDREPDDEYEATAGRKLDDMLREGGYAPADSATPAEQGVAAGAALAAKYDERGELVEAEEAALLAKLAALRAKNGDGAPPVATAAGARTYDQLFGQDE